MASGKDMMAADATYGGFINLVKLITVAAVVATTIVIALIA